MLLGFRQTTRLNCLRPAVQKHVQYTEDRRRVNQNAGRTREFAVGDKVFACFWYGTKRWRAGVVFRCSNDGTYEVHVGDQLHRRHVSQLLRDVGHLSETLENEASREEDTPIEEPPATNIAPVCI